MIQLISKSVERADLFIYSAALVGPLIFAITKDYAEVDESRNETSSAFSRITFKFPYGPAFFIVSIVVCMLAAFCYGASILSSFDESRIIIQTPALIKISIFVYCFSLMCLFAVNVYRAELEEAGRNLGDDERAFMEKWKARG